jgi:hypothetical protein
MNHDEKTKRTVLKENCTGDITDDTYVWRICSTKYLEIDIKKDQNTLVMPCFSTQNDALENPLRDKMMDLDGQKYQLFLDMMSTYYTQCWSLSDSLDWDYFGTTGDKIRIKCKANSLFDRLMNISDKFYSLNYHMAVIDYDDAEDIKKRYNIGDFDSFLDSNGASLVKSIMTIQDCWSLEQEVRLLYTYQGQANNSFPATHHIHGSINQYCSHVFDWQDVIEEYEMCPDNKCDNSSIKRWLEAYGAAKKN